MIIKFPQQKKGKRRWERETERILFTSKVDLLAFSSEGLSYPNEKTFRVEKNFHSNNSRKRAKVHQLLQKKQYEK